MSKFIIIFISIILFQFTLLCLNISGISTSWYFIEHNNYNTTTGELQSIRFEYNIFGLKQILNEDGIKYVLNIKYSDVMIKDRHPQYIQHFITIGVFQFLGLFNSIVGIISNIYGITRTSSYATLVTVVSAFLSLLFEIISCVLLATITLAFKKEFICSTYCSSLIGEANGEKWGIKGGFITSIIGIAFSLILIIFTLQRKNTKVMISSTPSSWPPPSQDEETSPQPMKVISLVQTPSSHPPVIIPSELDINTKDTYHIDEVFPTWVDHSKSNSEQAQYILKKFEPYQPKVKPTLPKSQSDQYNQSTNNNNVVIPIDLEIDSNQWYHFISQEIPVVDSNGVPTHYKQQYILNVHKK